VYVNILNKADMREADNNIQRELPMGSRAQELARKHSAQEVASTVAIPAH
jgi:hypothetical protein